MSTTTSVRVAPDAQGTATGPTATSVWRRARSPLAVLLLLVLVGVGVGLLRDGGGGRLDPDSYAPSGSRAVAEVLRQQGVPVTRVDTVEGVRAVAGPRVTVLVPDARALAGSELERLARMPGRLVVVGAEDDALSALSLPVETVGTTTDDGLRAPDCSLPAAQRAGSAEIDGLLYAPEDGVDAVGCYPQGSGDTLLRLVRPGGATTVLLGSGTVLTNDRVDEQGNAALALGLLGSDDTDVAPVEGDGARAVVWLVPRPGRPIPAGERGSLGDLLPDGLLLGALQLAIAVVVLALWRARRLGRVVEEPLPVVVRAAEAVEGRSRLYRAAGARDQAAQALRAGTSDRLARRLGLGPEADRAAVVQTAARRTDQPPGTLDALLYGAAPADDAALVRLADDLRSLERSLAPAALSPTTREVAGP